MFLLLYSATSACFRAWETDGGPSEKPHRRAPTLNSDLAVQDHHVLGVGGQPRLHGFTYGADLIQRWGVEVGPAKVMNLEEDGERKREDDVI